MVYDLEEILQVADRAGIYEDSVLPNYSGRGMYNKECLAIKMESLGDLLAFVVEVEKCGGMITDDFFGVARDNLGYSMLYYWPDIQINDPPYPNEDPDPDRREL